MDQVLCTQCHIEVRPNDYFCFNCGKNLKPKPLPTDAVNQLLYYVGSILLPPMGIIWGIRYMKEKSQTAKIVGVVCIIITVVVILVAVQATVQLMNTLTQQMNTGAANMLQF